jgi:hypothetical protein
MAKECITVSKTLLNTGKSLCIPNEKIRTITHAAIISENELIEKTSNVSLAEYNKNAGVKK